MKNQTTEKYIELAFRYIAALYQKTLAEFNPKSELQSKVKLESYQNESPNTRRKYYVDKMYHMLAAATRAKLQLFGNFENTKLLVRRFQTGEYSSKVLYYLSPLTREMAQIYAKYIALIWVMKQKKFLRKLHHYTEDLSVPNVYRSVRYTYYEGELTDFIRVPFKKLNGRSRYRNLRRNMESWDDFRKRSSYLLGDVPRDEDTGVWAARKTIEIPLYVPMPKGAESSANTVHIGHNGKTLSTMLFLVRFMNALEVAGQAKLLGNKKLDNGQTVAHTCLSALFTAPIFDLWMTSVPTYSHCFDQWCYFEGQEDMIGYLFGDYPLSGQSTTMPFDELAVADLGETNTTVSKILIRHAAIKRAFNSKDSEGVKAWLDGAIKLSYWWTKSIARNYFASFQYGLQSIEMGTDPSNWLSRPSTGGYHSYNSRVHDAHPAPEAFALSYLANASDLNKFMANEAKELKPVLSPSAIDPDAKTVKTAANLFPSHLLRDLLMASNTEGLFGFNLSEEPTDDEITRLTDFLATNVNYVTVQYEPVLNMVSALAEEMDKENCDHLKIYTKLALLLRGYRRYVTMKKEMQELPALQQGSDHCMVEDAQSQPSWERAVSFAGDGLILMSSQPRLLNEILDGKIDAAINLKNYTGRQQADVDAGTRSNTTISR